MAFVNTEAVSRALATIAFGGELDVKRIVRLASRRNISDQTVELWHAVDLSNLSTVRTFVVSSCEPEFIYEVDFFSRNDFSKDLQSVPDDLWSWGYVRYSSIIVTDRRKFLSRMASDMFVAVPTYRFEFLADDVQTAVETGQSDRPLKWALQSMACGYSYREYDVVTGTKIEDFSISTGTMS